MCDAELAPAIAHDERPSCPSCGAPLCPVVTAGAGRRLLAAAIDALVLAVTALPLHLALLALVDAPPLLAPARTPMGWLLNVLAADPAALLRRGSPVLTMGALYYVLFWSLSGQTPGARLLGVRVVAADGGPPSWARAVARALVRALGLLAGALGWVWALFDLERRAWHDKLAGTWVVREPREAAR